mmetsp:Transcript_55408/g.179737  ORF Transcript_55408/g.179737 Transcript_55408/m.179737 type:complete len:81 (-) Transcript_55408:38-280(-)
MPLACTVSVHIREGRVWVADLRRPSFQQRQQACQAQSSEVFKSRNSALPEAEFWFGPMCCNFALDRMQVSNRVRLTACAS